MTKKQFNPVLKYAELNHQKKQIESQLEELKAEAIGAFIKAGEIRASTPYGFVEVIERRTTDLNAEDKKRISLFRAEVEREALATYAFFKTTTYLKMSDVAEQEA